MTFNEFSQSKIPILFCTKRQLSAAHNLRSPLHAWVVIKDYRILEQDNILQITFVWLIDFKFESYYFRNSEIPL